MHAKKAVLKWKINELFLTIFSIEICVTGSQYKNHIYTYNIYSCRNMTTSAPLNHQQTSRVKGLLMVQKLTSNYNLPNISVTYPFMYTFP